MSCLCHSLIVSFSQDLIRHANFENFESQIRSARQHRGPRGSNEEGRSLQDYFTRGEGILVSDCLHGVSIFHISVDAAAFLAEPKI